MFDEIVLLNTSILSIICYASFYGKHKTVSAGVPWFSTLFGRDALLVAKQTLIMNPAIARETLTILALYHR